MVDFNLRKTQFQTFFLSKEIVKCPMLVEISRIGKRIKKLNLEIENNFIISISYGKRLLITTDDVNIENISNNDIVEIVDYDPIRNFVMVIGANNPNIETPVHWIVHHARNDINVIIQLNGQKVLNHFLDGIPITDKIHASGTIELSKEILKTLKRSNEIIIKNIGCMFVGMSLKDVENLIFKGDI